MQIMKKINNFLNYKYTFIIFFILVYLLGMILGIINYIKSDSYVIEIIAYNSKMNNLLNFNYKYFLNSNYSFQNSIFFSLILLPFKNNIIGILPVINMIVSIFLYLLFSYVIYKKSNKSFLLAIGLFVLLFNLTFNDYNYFGIETKIIFIGFILFYLTSKIENKYLRYSLYFINVLLNFSILYLFYFVIKNILNFKNKKNDKFDVIFCCILLFLTILLIRFNFSFSFSNLIDVILNSFNYNSKGSAKSFSSLFAIIVILLMIGNLIFLFFKSEEKNSIIEISFIFVLTIILMTFLKSNRMIVFNNKAYYIMFFMILLFFDWDLFKKSKSLNLYNEEKLNFNLEKLIFPFLLICLVLGVFSYKKSSEEDIYYRLKYDWCYDYTNYKFDYNDYFEDVDFKIINELGLLDDYRIENNVDLQTFSSDDEIFLYGFGDKEDSNGSRWTRKYAALNLYSLKNDDLYINLYNPENHYDLSISIYVDNICYYTGKTKLGTETIKIENSVKDEGNHIVKIICNDLPGKENNDKYLGVYVTNVVFTR